jgi:hypothetical protein
MHEEIRIAIEFASISLAFRSQAAAYLWFAKTLAEFEINDIAALPPLFCYNS